MPSADKATIVTYPDEFSKEEIRELAQTCQEYDLAFHLDGARLVNAAVASELTPAEIGREFDTVTLCFSKGLGCPLGALIAGPSLLMQRARRG